VEKEGEMTTREKKRAKSRRRSSEKLAAVRELRCLGCGTPMKTQIGDHPYAECGLPNVLLSGVPVSTCSECGKRSVAIPALEGLHRTLAIMLAKKPARLAPAEIKFLRKWLGYSGVDFAELIGTRPETLSRWESVSTPHPMDPTAEQLLRLMVLTREPLKEYPLEQLAPVRGEPDPLPLRLKRNASSKWKPEEPIPASAP
jgi:putative zinc finger/helix-turn-helix YgiT family protein